MFTYTVYDGIDQNTASVTITINPINDAPTIESTTIITDKDISVQIEIPVTDPDQDSLILTTTNPTNGTLTLSQTTVTYSPDSGFIGIDSFTCIANDGNNNSNIATITITVVDVNQPSGLSGSAYFATGSSKYLYNNHFSFESINEFSVTVWAKPLQQGYDTSSIVSIIQEDGKEFNIAVERDYQLKVSWNSVYKNTNLYLDPGKWNYISFTINSLGYNVYLNEQKFTFGSSIPSVNFKELE